MIDKVGWLKILEFPFGRFGVRIVWVHITLTTALYASISLAAPLAAFRLLISFHFCFSAELQSAALSIHLKSHKLTNNDVTRIEELNASLNT